MRADAQRNRDRILDVAREVFREHGYDASLDLIAKRAGVGPGTLYRHFPTREALMDGLMQSWIDRVDVTADKALAHEGSPRDVLLAWFEGYVALISAHKGMPAKITAALDEEGSPIRSKCQTLLAATERVVDDLRDRGAVRESVDPRQVFRLVGGVAAMADDADLDQAALRGLLEVLADGILRPA